MKHTMPKTLAASLIIHLAALILTNACSVPHESRSAELLEVDLFANVTTSGSPSKRIGDGGKTAHSHSVEKGEAKLAQDQNLATDAGSITGTEQSGGGHVFGEDEVDAPAQIDSSPRLKYPRQAYRDGIEGDVELFLVVNQMGRVTDAKITRPAGFGFDEVALEAANLLKFRPASVNGKDVTVHIHWIIHFRIDD